MSTAIQATGALALAATAYLIWKWLRRGSGLSCLAGTFVSMFAELGMDLPLRVVQRRAVHCVTAGRVIPLPSSTWRVVLECFLLKGYVYDYQSEKGFCVFFSVLDLERALGGDRTAGGLASLISETKKKVS